MIGLTEAAIAIGVFGSAGAYIANVFKWHKASVADAVCEESKDREAAMKALTRDVEHNRQNADQKFIAADHRIEQTLRDIVVLQRADERHTSAIQHLDQSIKNYHSTIERRLEDFSRLNSVQFDALRELIGQMNANRP